MQRRRRGVGGASGGATTYAISVCLCVRSVLVLGVCGRGAAPAVGCRVGGSSGNDHVEGVLGVLREVTTRRVTKTSKKGGETFTYLLFGVTPLNLLLKLCDEFYNQGLDILTLLLCHKPAKNWHSNLLHCAAPVFTV